MFQLFLRARARNLKAAIVGSDFKARSSERDAVADRSRIASVMSAVENALSSTESEQAGLRSRMDDVLARASISVGTNADEYLDREPHRTAALNFFDHAIAKGESRLKELGTMIAHFKFVKTAMLTRFPELKVSVTNRSSLKTGA
jgi:hypothetical protein